MEIVLDAYQVAPGKDVLHFSHTYEECKHAALEQRRDLREYDEDYRDHLDAMAVYECKMLVPDADVMIEVLNHPDDEQALFRLCVVDKQIVGVVAE